MADLTTTEKRYIRMMSGDMATTPEVGDDDLQMLYDHAADEDCGCANQLDTTVVWVLRTRVALAQKLVDQTNEAQVSKSLSQKRAALEKDLARWEKMCGMDSGRVRVGSFSLGLDTPPQSEWASMPRWWLQLVGIL